MPTPSRRVLRRSAWALGAAAALTGTFVLGVVAGAGSTPDSPERSSSVL